MACTNNSEFIYLSYDYEIKLHSTLILVSIQQHLSLMDLHALTYHSLRLICDASLVVMLCIKEIASESGHGVEQSRYRWHSIWHADRDKLG